MQNKQMNRLTRFKKIPVLLALIAMALVVAATGAAGAGIIDFNGDGHPDFVLQFQNLKTPKTAIWYLNNNVFISSASGPTLPSFWFLVDTADFNRDGHPDYLLLDSGSSPDTEILYLSGRTLVGSARGPSVPRVPSGWGWVGTGDFNHDGYPDYLLYNTNTRQTGIWYLNNNVFIGGAYGLTLPAGWALVGVADFNRDGHPDYVLENGTGRTAIWYLSGRTLIGSAYGPTLPSGPWSLAATVDFNGDGNPDYVLYNTNTRQTAIWYLNNNVFISGAWGPTLPADWSLFPDPCDPWDYVCQ
jgi:FG-GAP-like repeat